MRVPQLKWLHGFRLRTHQESEMKMIGASSAVFLVLFVFYCLVCCWIVL